MTKSLIPTHVKARWSVDSESGHDKLNVKCLACDTTFYTLHPQRLNKYVRQFIREHKDCTPSAQLKEKVSA